MATLPSEFPSGLRVMVVDDDPLCLRVVEQMLRRCSYDVRTCTNVGLGLRMLTSASPLHLFGGGARGSWGYSVSSPCLSPLIPSLLGRRHSRGAAADF